VDQPVVQDNDTVVCSKVMISPIGGGTTPWKPPIASAFQGDGFLDGILSGEDRWLRAQKKPRRNRGPNQQTVL